PTSVDRPCFTAMRKFKSARPLALAIAAILTGHVDAVTITVNSSDDDAASMQCNLRSAITAINFGNAVRFPACAASLTGNFGDRDTVIFAASLANSTITLAQGQLSNYAPLTISGSGQTIDAHGASRVLYTTAFTALSNLRLTGGATGAGQAGG